MALDFTIPPLPGEPLLTITAVARRAGCSRQAIYDAIAAGKIGAATVAGRIVIAESEADRFIREWPVRPKGQAVAARW
ncbi:MAG TPA: helix-turn-helix domain-containing protein, partial [Stellaceae bacterium]